MSFSKTSTLNVLLADDHDLILQGLRALLADAPDMSVVAVAHNGAEAVRLHREIKPDVTLMDIRMPEMTGIEALAAIRKATPQARVIMLAAEDFQSEVLQSWQLGAAGFLLKTVCRKYLIDAIRSAWQHGWCSPFEPGKLPPGAKGERVLSDRELDVLDYVRRGFPNADIATALEISVHTVKVHLKTIFLKLDSADRTEAVVAAIERGLLRVSPNHTEKRSIQR